MKSLNQTSGGKIIFKEVKKTQFQYIFWSVCSLKYNLLRDVIADGGKNTCGTEKRINWTYLQNLGKCSF